MGRNLRGTQMKRTDETWEAHRWNARSTSHLRKTEGFILFVSWDGGAMLQANKEWHECLKFKIWRSSVTHWLSAFLTASKYKPLFFLIRAFLWSRLAIFCGALASVKAVVEGLPFCTQTITFEWWPVLGCWSFRAYFVLANWYLICK